MQYIGIDVSKATFVVAYGPEKSRKTSTFANTAAGIKKFMKTIDPSKHHCVMEATGNYISIPTLESRLHRKYGESSQSQELCTYNAYCH